MRLALILGAMLALFVAAPSQASTIFQSVDDLAARPNVTGLCTSCNDRFVAYEGVRLDTDAYITNIDLAVRDFAGACCFYENHLFVKVYDGSPDDPTAPLIYSHRVFNFGTGHPPQDELTRPGIRTEWETALLNFQTPDLLLLKNHDYTFSFVDSDFHIPVFRTGYSPLYFDGGPVYGAPPRQKVVIYLSNGQQSTEGAAGFRLNGIATDLPEPATWALMIGGLAGVGAAARRRRSLAV